MKHIAKLNMSVDGSQCWNGWVMARFTRCTQPVLLFKSLAHCLLQSQAWKWTRVQNVNLVKFQIENMSSFHYGSSIRHPGRSSLHLTLLFIWKATEIDVRERKKKRKLGSEVENLLASHLTDRGCDCWSKKVVDQWHYKSVINEVWWGEISKWQSNSSRGKCLPYNTFVLIKNWRF